MFFLNLSAGEFLGLLGVLGATITALYFLDRSKRRKMVSTLQFWVSAAGATEQRSRKKVNQPWSLVLQLLSLALLLLAIAQLQWGTRAAAGRDHVLLLDTSAWSGARSTGGTVLRQELGMAAQYLASLPSQDRVLLARADALTVPATTFTADREQTRNALRESVSSLSSLDLPAALTYAEGAQRASGGLPGEIVYLGPERVGGDATGIVLPRNLRILSTPVTGTNCGIRRIEVRRGDTDPNSWHAQIALMNYGRAPQSVTLQTQFAGTRFAVRRYLLIPSQELTADYSFVTNTEGQLSATIEGDDVFPQDNHASLRLPGNNTYNIAVYTRRPELLRPVLNADRRIMAKFLDPASLTQSQLAAKPAPDLVIFDEASYSQTLPYPAIWINPAEGASPFQVKEVVNKIAIRNWNSNALMAAGLHAREERVPQARIFRAKPGDITLASIDGSTGAGPVVLLRSATGVASKAAAIGFDPFDSHLRYTVATPLLFANLLEWMAPVAVRATELRAGHVGDASLELAPDEAATNLKVVTDEGVALPFTVHERTLQLFAGSPMVAHIISASRETILSLTLPDVAQATWTPAQSEVAKGLPAMADLGASSIDLWQWLALLGAAGLLAEWLLFGRARSLRRPAGRSARSDSVRVQHDEDLVAQ